jgi:addiction module HigA family antidote
MLTFTAQLWRANSSLPEGLMAKKPKPVHRGEILREEFMTALVLSMNKMAMALRVPVTRIADVVDERRGITADTALWKLPSTRSPPRLREMCNL